MQSHAVIGAVIGGFAGWAIMKVLNVPFTCACVNFVLDYTTTMTIDGVVRAPIKTTITVPVLWQGPVVVGTYGLCGYLLVRSAKQRGGFGTR
jgi:hypothetical protein